MSAVPAATISPSSGGAATSSACTARWTDAVGCIVAGPHVCASTHIAGRTIHSCACGDYVWASVEGDRARAADADRQYPTILAAAA